MSVQISTEERLQLKHTARQRLIGAVVLLLVAALVLPWLLDEAPRKNALPVVVKGAGQREGVPVAVLTPTLSTTMPLPAAPMPAAPTSVPATVPAASRAPAANLPAVPVVPPLNLRESVPVAESGQHSSPIPSSKLQSPVQNALPKTEKSVAPVSAVPSEQSPAAVKRSGYVVQLGVFGNAGNVRQLRKRLQAAGVESYTETMPSGAIRVRSGPFAHRADADRVLATLRLADIQAQIVPLSH